MRIAWIGLILLIAGCGPIPRDPEKTSDRVRQTHTIRVGISEAPPWVVRNGEEPRGIEADLVRAFAQSIGAQPEWRWAGEQAHMQALEHFQLDLLIGGLTKKTPWKTDVGLTDTYFRQHVMAAPPGENAWIKQLDEFLGTQKARVEEAAKGAQAQ